MVLGKMGSTLSILSSTKTHRFYNLISKVVTTLYLCTLRTMHIKVPILFSILWFMPSNLNILMQIKKKITESKYLKRVMVINYFIEHNLLFQFLANPLKLLWKCLRNWNSYFLPIVPNRHVRASPRSKSKSHDLPLGEYEQQYKRQYTTSYKYHHRDTRQLLSHCPFVNENNKIT